MADVVVRESHTLQPAEAAERMRGFEGSMRKYGVKAKWSGHKAALEGTGVAGRIEVSAADVTVTVRLGMLARVAGVDPKRLEVSIRRRIRAALSA
jgi:putative polyhydroxyalkanoate system protein